MHEQLPFAVDMGVQIDALERDRVVVLAPFSAQSLRPGGTISGPTMMGLADVALYALVLAQVGLEPLAVTTSLNMNFLRKPAPADLLAVARPLKVGKRLVVGEVSLYTAEDLQRCLAHATGTYSVPPLETDHV